MKIKCRECNTIYDDKEKYCPYCFSRTNPHNCYHLNDENIKTKQKKTVSLTSKPNKRKSNQASGLMVFILVFTLAMIMMIGIFILFISQFIFNI